MKKANSNQADADYSRGFRVTVKVLVCALVAAFFVHFSFGVAAKNDANDDANENVTLDEQIQDIKSKALQLNRDLFILEEELLFPDNTQLAIFVSMDVGEFFALDAVKLSIDGDVVSHYLYTERQLDALQRGGVHRLYMGNLKTGQHEVVAVFTGKGPSGRDYRRATQLTVEKTTGAKHIELIISDAEEKRQPQFSVKEW